MTTRELVSEDQLLAVANQEIKKHPSYIEGMCADSVEEKDGVLVFKGEFFLDSQGLPTEETTLAFNVFKHLALTLSKQYSLS